MEINNLRLYITHCTNPIFDHKQSEMRQSHVVHKDGGIKKKMLQVSVGGGSLRPAIQEHLRQHLMRT